MTPPVIVIGAGHNALISAALLARGGAKVLVLERSDRVGGCARTSELAPGFRVPTLAHRASIDPAIVRALDLERHGLRTMRPDVDAWAPAADGRALVLWRDRARAAADIRALSGADADRYPRFLDVFAKLSAVVRGMAAAPPPDIDDPGAADMVELLKTGRRFRALGKTDAHHLLRWMPMPVADLVGEWFESEPLRALLGAGGVFGSFLAPRSAGSGALLLLLGAVDGHPIPGSWIAGGPGRLGDALAAAARASGVEIRTGTEVTGIAIENGAAQGVHLAGGEFVPARAVVSGLDPRATLLRLVDPVHLEPEAMRRLRNIRCRGTLAKVNYAVAALPRFSALAGRPADEQRQALAGRLRIAATLDSLERAFDAAKYGRWSDTPWIELTVPSILDPDLAPANAHVVSAYVQYAPYSLRGTTWDAERDRLADRVTAIVDALAPGFAASVIARETITPLDLERTYGLTGGQIFHGELALDQFYVTRPMLGWARYATPVRNLFLCGSGTHPGTGLDGRAGANAAATIARAARP